jgi:hypothetical protein
MCSSFLSSSAISGGSLFQGQSRLVGMSAIEDSTSEAIAVLEADSSPSNVEQKMLSKNQQKRLLREKLRQATKGEWRKKQKEKRKSRLQAKKAEYESKGMW